MLIIEYNSKVGDLFPDALTLDVVRSDYKTAQLQTIGDHIRTIASELYITALRLLVATGEIDHRLVKIIHIRSGELHGNSFDIVIRVDKFGQLCSWPEGFCDTGEKLLIELIASQSESKNKEVSDV